MKTILIFVVFFALLAVPCIADAIELSELKVKVDYDEAYTYSLEKKDRIDTINGITNSTKINVQILPGSNVTFTLKIENTMDGTDVKGVTAKITIEELDDGADVDVDSDEFDLDAGNEERVDLVIPVPLDVESGSYNFLIEIEGHDKAEKIYRKDILNKFDVSRLTTDLRITKAQLSPGIVSCDRKTTVTVEIMNLGRADQNDAALEIQNVNFGINSVEKNIPLKSSQDSEDSSKYQKKLAIEVPKFMRAGIYTITANLYWKNYVLFDRKKMELTVKDCDQSKISKPNETRQPVQSTNISNTTSTTGSQPSTGKTPSEIGASTNFGLGNLYTTVEKSPARLILIVGLIFMIIAAAAVLVILAYKSLQNRNSKL